MSDGTCQRSGTGGSQCTSPTDVSSSSQDNNQPLSTHRTAVIAVLIVIVAVVFVLLIGSLLYFIYYRHEKSTSYHMLMPRSGDGLPSLGSDTEDELFSKS